jgi:hypothetical protein
MDGNYLDIQGTILSTVKDGHIHLIQIPEEAVNTSGLSETAVSMPLSLLKLISSSKYHKYHAYIFAFSFKSYYSAQKFANTLQSCFSLLSCAWSISSKILKYPFKTRN